jgi:hypothetical protein
LRSRVATPRLGREAAGLPKVQEPELGPPEVVRTETAEVAARRSAEAFNFCRCPVRGAWRRSRAWGWGGVVA